MREGGATLFAGLVLAIASAACINLGYRLEHVAMRAATPAGAGLGAQLWASIRSARWLAGLALTALGFAGQVTAIAIAPLSLVPAFAAGGLALSVPLASRLFSLPVRRNYALAVLVMAAALACLPLGLPQVNEHLSQPSLYALALPVLALAFALALPGARHLGGPPALTSIAAAGRAAQRGPGQHDLADDRVHDARLDRSGTGLLRGIARRQRTDHRRARARDRRRTRLRAPARGRARPSSRTPSRRRRPPTGGLCPPLPSE